MRHFLLLTSLIILSACLKNESLKTVMLDAAGNENYSNSDTSAENRAAIAAQGSLSYVESRGGYKFLESHNNPRYAPRVYPALFKDPGKLSSVRGSLISNRPVLLTHIDLEATGLPEGLHSADICLFSRTLGKDAIPSELGCKFAMIKEKKKFVWKVRYPIGVFLPKNSTKGCTVAINAHRNKWTEAERKNVKFRCRLYYKEYKPGMAYGQILRIPYLDSVWKGPNLIDKGPWYHNASKHMMVIRGMGYFIAGFGPGDFNFQACVERKGKDGKLIGRNCSQRIERRAGEDYDPPSFKAFTVGMGKGAIEATCRASSSDISGDCVIYLLVQKPAIRGLPSSVSTFEHNRGFIYRPFLEKNFCEKKIYDVRHQHVISWFGGGITKAGVEALDAVIKSRPEIKTRKQACNAMFQ